MKKQLRYAAITGLTVLVLLQLFYILRHEAKRNIPVPILMYHEIGAAENSPWCVPVETFRAQMAGLKEQGFKAILPSEIAAHLKWGKPLPRKPVIITFDDGYLCNLTTVEPILKENGFQAVVYLITAQVSETPEHRYAYENKPCLSWPEVIAMQKRRIFAFGGHSSTHVNLPGSGNPDAETTACFRQLARHGISMPYSFCYPYGQQNEDTKRMVRKAGFQTAVICEDAVAQVKPSVDLFALPRVSVMGGKHEFRLISGSIESDKQTLVCRILHSGIPLEISPGLGLRGQEPIWLPAREVADGEFELRFVLPKNVSQDTVDRLEIMDKHRLFRLAVINQ